MKKLVNEQNIKVEVEHESENAAENEDKYKFIEERTKK
jgi:hypothetical protein